MSDYFLGEIRAFPFNFAPRNWVQCNGQTLSIAQNQALFSLLGTTYGGNGVTTFNLPNLQGRAPLHLSSSHPEGEMAGVPTVTLNTTQVPPHTHLANCSTIGGNGVSPTNTVLAPTTVNVYTQNTQFLLPLNAVSVSSVGGNQPHDNMMPYQVVNYCIAINGIYPSRN